MADKLPPNIGSRWWCPSLLEVPGGPWGTSTSFAGDAAAGWMAAIDWHARNGLNVIIADIPFAQTDRVYIGWGFHYILDLSNWTHGDDLYSLEFRRRNVETINRILAHAKKAGVRVFIHHFNFIAPRRMAVAEGWCKIFSTRAGDVDTSGLNADAIGVLLHELCWNAKSYQAFMRHCWEATLQVLPDLAGIVATIGEGNAGLFPRPNIYEYYSSMRFLDVAVDFTNQFVETVRKAGRTPIIRAWGVEWARHLMPKGVDYLVKYQLFDCIDAPADEVLDQWLDHGHDVWAEAEILGENAGPILWTRRDYFKKVGREVRRRRLKGIVSHLNSAFEVALLDTPSSRINFELFFAGINSPRSLESAAPWEAVLRETFGDQASGVLSAMELISQGVLNFSRVIHRVGEGFTFGWHIGIAPYRQFPCNLGQANGTPPQWARNGIATIKEYLDYLSTHRWHADALQVVRGERACPIEVMKQAARDAEEAERLLESLVGNLPRAALREWSILRCSAGLCRFRALQIASLSLAKVLFAAVRNSIDPKLQRELAQQSLDAFKDAELAAARVREWAIQIPPGHLTGDAYQRLIADLSNSYQETAFEMSLYTNDLRRLLNGEAWTLSLHEMSWKGLQLDEVIEWPGEVVQDLKRRLTRPPSWNEEGGK
ncbi:MAG TPA: hypothetical protein VK968_13925 [Roseimicrobium sp.]|nr:hypothetical protein [Roseimicrobium sp.]